MTKTRSIWLKSLGVGLLALVGSLFFLSVEAAISVSIGIAIALVNFWLLERLVKGLVSQEVKKPLRLVLIFVLKVGFIFGALSIVILKMSIETVPFLLGLSCVVGGILLEGISGLFSTQNLTDAS